MIRRIVAFALVCLLIAAAHGSSNQPVSMGATLGGQVWSPLLKHTSAEKKVDMEQEHPAALAECINSVYEFKNMTWEAAMRDDVAAIKVAGVWWSSKPRGEFPVTVVTQTSLDRLPQLLAQCQSWGGPLSAVVYFNLIQESTDGLIEENAVLLQSATELVDQFFATAEVLDSACKLDLMLAYEVYADERAASMLYPINVLRNYARLQARTPVIALVDVDMLISSKLYEYLARKDTSSTLIEHVQEKKAYILPAFEIHGHMLAAAALADRLIGKTKQELVAVVMKGKEVEPFKATKFPIGHNCTRFSIWFGTSEEYQTDYTTRCEPWVVVDRFISHWHDVRFRGYGQNKIVHLEHLNATGFRFTVHPEAFIVHRAHPETSGSTQYRVDLHGARKAELAGANETDTTTIYGHVYMLLNSAKEAMLNGTFIPVLDDPTLKCRRNLTWWRDGPLPELPEIPPPVPSVPSTPEGAPLEGAEGVLGEGGLVGEGGEQQPSGEGAAAQEGVAGSGDTFAAGATK